MLAVDVDTDALRLALVLGALAALAVFVAALLWRRARPGLVGLPIAIAALFTIRHYLSPAAAPVYIFVAAGVAFAAGEIAERWEHPLAALPAGARWRGVRGDADSLRTGGRAHPGRARSRRHRPRAR